jgi:hypothetical protein
MAFNGLSGAPRNTGGRFDTSQIQLNCTFLAAVVDLRKMIPKSTLIYVDPPDLSTTLDPSPACCGVGGVGGVGYGYAE